MSDVKPTMYLFTTQFNGIETFGLVPVNQDCTFSKGIYDRHQRCLVMFSSKAQEGLHLIPKLDQNGDVLRSKKPRSNGMNIVQQRVTLDTYNEFYLAIEEEITELIKMIALNCDTYEYQRYFKPLETPEQTYVSQMNSPEFGSVTPPIEVGEDVIVSKE